MRRNTSNWIARIFSIASASATPLVSSCRSTPLTGIDMQSVPSDSTADLPLADMTPTTDAAADMGATIRRPFLVGSSLRAAAAASRADWLEPFAAANDLDVGTRQALAAAWLKDALEEHASVAAFARFSIMGLAVGAPPDLIADAQRASLDEIRHARICFGLACRYGAREIGPATLRVDDAFPAATLTEVAMLAAKEGCVGETLGALLAERQALIATDPAVKKALAKIAGDERHHAELSWRFVSWACHAGGSPIVDRVYQAVALAVRDTRRMAVRPLEADLDSWHAHGRLSCAEAKQVAEEGILTIVLPALARLCGDDLSAVA